MLKFIFVFCFLCLDTLMNFCTNLNHFFLVDCLEFLYIQAYVTTNKDSFTSSFSVWKMSSCVVDRRSCLLWSKWGFLDAVAAKLVPTNGPAVQMNSSGFRISLKTCSEVVLKPGLAWGLNKIMYEGSLA